MKDWRAICLAGLVLAGCRRARVPPPTEAHQVLEGLSMSQFYRGSPSWELQAKTATLKDDARRAALTSPEIRFYKDKKPVSRVTALSGFIRLDTQDVRLSSSVVVTSAEDNSVLKTEELDYSSAKKRFVTDKEVVVRRPDGVLHGRGLEATPDLSEIRIFNQSSVIKETRK